MAKVTIEGITYEGTPKELREIFESMCGVKFPNNNDNIRPTIGHYVKVIANESNHNASIGDIVKIITDEEDDHPFECENIYGKSVGWFFESEVEAMTTVEIETKLSEIKLEEKWAKIGRKLNELKEGDFVKYKKCYAEVTRVGIYDISIKAPNGIIPVNFEEVSLIFPVESRFDKDSE